MEDADADLLASFDPDMVNFIMETYNKGLFDITWLYLFDCDTNFRGRVMEAYMN